MKGLERNVREGCVSHSGFYDAGELEDSGMDAEELGHCADACVRDYPPPCTCACPLGLDVRGLVAKLRRKNFTAAYRLYRNQVLFPAIVSRICRAPCQARCVRAPVDSGVLLRKLEAACVDFAQDKAPLRYTLPEKAHAVAIVGGGLSGLSCALKLGMRNYSVTVFERQSIIGGSLRHQLPEEFYLEELRLQFDGLPVHFVTGRLVQTLDELQADAIFIATGKGGDSFAVLDSGNAHSLGTGRPGVFFGGAILGMSGLEGMAQGIRTSYLMERYMQTGRMGGVPEACAPLPEQTVFYSFPVAPLPLPDLSSKPFLQEAALLEAERCLLCNCAACNEHCELMQHFNAFPMKIARDVAATLQPIEKLTQRIASRLINSCTFCGLCKKVCPEGIDMERCLLEARRRLHQDGVLPPVYHDFWLRDMHFSNSTAWYLHCPKETVRPTHLFFPGCQLGASDPAYVLRSFAYLEKILPNPAVLLGCCAAPAEWAGDEELRNEELDRIRRLWGELGKPILIFACPSCHKIFLQYLSECETISLYTLLAESSPPVPGDLANTSVSIFDPCTSKEDPLMGQSVRILLEKNNVHVRELYPSSSLAACCGFGGHIYAANPVLAEKMARQRVGLDTYEYVTYCVNCRDIFTFAGKACRHVLDFFFTDNKPLRKAPSLTVRRKNRLALKEAFQWKEGGEHLTDAPLSAQDGRLLRISEDLIQKMNRLLILEDDLWNVVDYCEKSGEKLLDPATGRYTGHLRIAYTTYWVVYSVIEDVTLVHNVYCHRLAIDEKKNVL